MLALNLAVKRNIKRFPKDFMFQLTNHEFKNLRFPIEILENDKNSLRFQNKTLKKGRGQHIKYLPYAWDNDAQLNQIYDAMENLMDEKQPKINGNDRERIGF